MSYLDRLLSSTRERLEESKAKVHAGALEGRLAALDAPLGFKRALERAGDEVAVIAEIKRASPSAGVFAPNLNASEVAGAFERGGAAALSVLTEPEFFRGQLEDIASAKAAGLPVLRKDFVLDDYQVLESRAAGADAVLLIVRVLEGDALARLLRAAETLGMDALVEVYDEGDLERAAGAGAGLIGVNNRDLETFEVDPERTLKLAPHVPSGCTLVALSGVSTSDQVTDLGRAGARAVLVGEALVRAEDPEAALRSLRGG